MDPAEDPRPAGSILSQAHAAQRVLAANAARAAATSADRSPFHLLAATGMPSVPLQQPAAMGLGRGDMSLGASGLAMGGHTLAGGSQYVGAQPGCGLAGRGRDLAGDGQGQAGGSHGADVRADDNGVGHGRGKKRPGRGRGQGQTKKAAKKDEEDEANTMSLMRDILTALDI